MTWTTSRSALLRRTRQRSPRRARISMMGDTSPWSTLKSELYSLVGRNPKSNTRVPSIAGLEPSNAVLDIGCGPGAAVRAAAGSVAKAVGVDRSEAMIEIARRRSGSFNNVEFFSAGVEDLPFADDSFDRVWTINAFHHWEDQARGIEECLRVLEPSGRLLIAEQDTRGSHGLNLESAQELVERLRSSGFADASISNLHRQIVVTGFRNA